MSDSLRLRQQKANENGKVVVEEVHPTPETFKRVPIDPDQTSIRLLAADNGKSGSEGLQDSSSKLSPRKHILALRQSGNGIYNITRARNRTLRLTLVIVLTFIFCATPYVVMTLWYIPTYV